MDSAPVRYFSDPCLSSQIHSCLNFHTLLETFYLFSQGNADVCSSWIHGSFGSQCLLAAQGWAADTAPSNAAGHCVSPVLINLCECEGVRGHVLRRLRGHARYAHRLPVAGLFGLSEVRSAGRVGKSWLLSALDHSGTQVHARCWSIRTDPFPPSSPARYEGKNQSNEIKRSFSETISDGRFIIHVIQRGSYIIHPAPLFGPVGWK